MGSGLEKLPRKMAAGHLFLLLFHQPVSGQDYQIGGDYQIQAAEDGYDYEYQNAIANANANERHRACPRNRPALGSPCSLPGSIRCSYGSECCCGKCHPSFVATCQSISRRHSSWVGYNTDACLRPNCGNGMWKDCPKNQPALGSLCAVPASVSCSYGSGAAVASAIPASSRVATWPM